ncbi:MAG: hypothetical protein J5958_00465, partial [Clostridia bacterium]|nr:hypothetical protein [Clostridia bacterium]
MKTTVISSLTRPEKDQAPPPPPRFDRFANALRSRHGARAGSLSPPGKSFFKKGLLFQIRYDIIPIAPQKRPVGQEAKTSPSHGENM